MTHILRMLIFALRRKGSSAVAVPFASALRPILQCCAAERPLATRDAGALPWRSQSQDIPASPSAGEPVQPLGGWPWNVTGGFMIRSILMGLVAGQRAMTPLAALAAAAQRDTLPYDNPEARLMKVPLIAAGGVAMAAAEIAGDKMKSAPDRTVFLGLLARTITGGFAGSALAPPQRRLRGAAAGIGAAVVSSYCGLAARKWAMERWGQTATGFVEDAIVMSAAITVASKD